MSSRHLATQSSRWFGVTDRLQRLDEPLGLRQVFTSAPADVQFGIFSAMYAPNSGGKAAVREAVVRVDLGAARGGRARSLPCFLVLPADDVDRYAPVCALCTGSLHAF